ncbi:hypothetical protein [Desulfobacter postgatei]|uniref:hypothetical protein n=1 Tax=Desulfobacter postgatei TaxID=2293 RepID=UPI00259AFA2C|nr:hypothetical protein [uncultured Desulfobacter sp.]
MTEIEMDKLSENYTLRIPAVLWENLSKLPPRLKKILNERLMVEMARAVHESRFNPEQYLSSKEF